MKKIFKIVLFLTIIVTILNLSIDHFIEHDNYKNMQTTNIITTYIADHTYTNQQQDKDIPKEHKIENKITGIW